MSEQAPQKDRPWLIAVVCGVIVAWLTMLAVGAVVDAKGWRGLVYLPYIAGPALGFIVASMMLAGDRARGG